ncbi:NosD domain-containing protein [[Eubacterium] cellulosolvens]
MVANNEHTTTPHTEGSRCNNRARRLIVVDKDGFGDYTTIQGAIDSAKAGDIITVHPGNYDENIKINKMLTLIGNSTASPKITGDPNDNGIYINSDKVTVSGFGIELHITMAYKAGIYLYNANNCTIENNYIAGVETGIQLSNSDWNNIQYNECNLNFYGIHLQSSDSNTIRNNTITDSESKAIAIQSSMSNIVINNTCKRKGIWLGNSRFTRLYNNYLFYSSVWITGDKLAHWDSHTIGKDNLVNGKPLYYWKNKLGQTIPTDAGSVILANCKNIFVKDLDVSDVTVGIELGYSEKITIDNITCHASSYYYNNYAVYLNESHNNTITNIDCKDNLFGIRLETSNFNTISRNTFVYSNSAIHLYHSEHNMVHNNYGTGNWHEIELAYSNSNLITNNIVHNNSHGLFISESNGNVIKNNTWDINNGYGLYILDSYNNTIINDTYVNGLQGIYLANGDYNKFMDCKCLSNLKGIVIFTAWENEIINCTGRNNYEGLDLLGNSKNNTVINSTFWNNKEGIHINYSAKNNNITDNLICNNTQVGIISESLSNNNIIFKNMIITNSQQALDDNKSNHWDDSSEGNYWSDYKSRYPSASNNGHVWNIPYDIPGLGGAKDYYPLVNNTKTLPQNTKPIAVIDDIIPNPGIEGMRVTFWGRVMDEEHVGMSYHWESDLDGVLSDQPVFTSSSLSVGNHTISFKAQDYDGLWSDITQALLTINKQIPKPPYEGPPRPHEPILIRSNDEFTGANGVTWGTGTKENPYIIESWDISAKNHIGIHIRDTDAHFIIRNCNVSNGKEELIDGIALSGVQNGTIENNWVVNNQNGIDLHSAENNIIRNNTCKSNLDYGIYISSYSKFILIFNNTCLKNRVGITVYGEDNFVENNICDFNSESGIHIEGKSLHIINNKCNNNSFGLLLGPLTEGNVLKSNICDGNLNYGIYFQHYLHEYFEIVDYVFEDNIINGKQVEWYCHRKGTVNNPIIVKNNKFIDSKMINLGNILLYNCSYFRLESNTISSSEAGIIIYNSHDIEITQNKINNSNQYGIYIKNSNYISILNNNISDNYNNIYLFNSSNNSIINNLCTKRDYGIYLRENCNDNTITNNICSNTSWAGIYLWQNCINNYIDNNTCDGNGYGINVVRASNNTFSNNSCLNNNLAGIYIAFEGYNLIEFNNCSSNDMFGIHISGSSRNIISNNTCSYNKHGIEVGPEGSRNSLNNNIISSNTDYGIWIFESIYNTIFNNDIINNGDFGVCCSPSSSNNFIYKNEFINNSINTSQAYDNGTNNAWDVGYPTGGNYWSDYTGIDNYSGPNQDQEGEDGIGDTPYAIAGDSNFDNYPLVKPKPAIIDIDKIQISLKLNKSEFYLDEQLTGTIRIINDNPFEITLAAPYYLQRLMGDHFLIYSLDNDSTYAGCNNYDLYPIEVLAKDSITIEFNIDKIYTPPSTLRVNATTELSPGNYSIHAYFLYENVSKVEKINSNFENFKIISEKLPDRQNVTIILELDKSEYSVGEHITGKINIQNNNSFDITLDNFPLHQYIEHFDIYSVDTNDSYHGYLDQNLYPMEVKARNITVIDFRITRFAQLPLPAKEANYTNLQVGNYTTSIELYSGNFTNYNLVKSNNVTFTIIENQSIPPVGPDGADGDKGKGRAGPYDNVMFYSVVGVLIAIIIITTTFIAGTEVGKYGFFGAIVPLYTKTRKKKIDKNYGYKKGLVLGYILGTPGESYNAIKRILNLNNGTLAYYLKVLEREGTIKAERDGMYKRFYPSHGNITKEVIELTDVQKDIYQTIKEHMGITQKEISTLIGVTQSTVNYHVQLMVDARILRMEREGKKTKCYILEDNS